MLRLQYLDLISFNEYNLRDNVAIVAVLEFTREYLDEHLHQSIDYDRNQ